MADTIDCARCGNSVEALPKAPLPGAIGKEIQGRVCPDCWAEWQRMEVMVINELRLNFMDPDAVEVLAEQMKKFLFEAADTASMPVPDDVQL